MRIYNFEEVLSWQKSQILAEKVYISFRDSRDFSFRDQIQRLVVSISSNIAEGFERQTNNELKYFLYVAKGSCGEFRSLVLLAERLGYISWEIGEEYYDSAVEISKLLSAFIKTLSH